LPFFFTFIFSPPASGFHVLTPLSLPPKRDRLSLLSQRGGDFAGELLLFHLQRIFISFFPSANCQLPTAPFVFLLLSFVFSLPASGFRLPASGFHNFYTD
jgi:hypothetical protein